MANDTPLSKGVQHVMSIAVAKAINHACSMVVGKVAQQVLLKAFVNDVDSGLMGRLAKGRVDVRVHGLFEGGVSGHKQGDCDDHVTGGYHGVC